MKRAKIRTLQGFPGHAKNVENVDKNKKACKIMEKRMMLIQQKIHTKEGGYALLGVDNVDNLFSKQRFADFYDVSGTHSYQQVAVHTFF
jgi:hypothetical protein